ncbi:MAG: PAS domain S-box protein, partial [Ilumatobacteraceae bacterium]
VGRDVTQRHLLQSERARFQWMIEQSSALVFLSDLQGQWVYANSAMREAIGVGLDDSNLDVSNTSLFGADEAATRVLNDVIGPQLAATGNWSGPFTFANQMTGGLTEVISHVQLLEDPLQPGMRFYAVVSRDVSEVNTLERADRRRRELGAFAAQVAHRALEDGIDEVVADLGSVVASFGVLSSANIAYLGIIDQSERVLRVMSSVVEPGGEVRPLPAVAIPLDHVQGWIELVNSKRVLINPVAGESDMLWTADLSSTVVDKAMGAHLCARLRVGSNPLGLLGVIDHDLTRKWTADEVDTIEQVAHTMANLLQRQRTDAALRADVEAAELRGAYEQVQLAVAEWAVSLDPDELLGGIDVHLEHLGRTLDADLASMMLIEGDRLSIQARWTSANGTSANGTSANATPANATSANATAANATSADQTSTSGRLDTANDVRSAMAVPLVSGGRSIGVIAIGMCARRHWTEAESALVQGVANTIATVLTRRRVQSSLRSSEHRLAALLDGSPDLIVVVGDDGITQYVNNAVRRLFGASGIQLVGSSALEFIHHDDRELAATRLGSLLRGEPTPAPRVRAVREDGSIGWWEITSGSHRDPLAGGMILTCREVTTHVEAEQLDAVRVARLQYAFDVAQSALDRGAKDFLTDIDSVTAKIAEMLDVDVAYIDRLDEHHRMLTGLSRSVRGRRDGRDGDDGPMAIDVPFAEVPLWIERLRQAQPVNISSAAQCSEGWAVQKRARFGTSGAMMAVAMSAAGELVGVLGVSMRTAMRQFKEDELTFLRIVAETVSHILQRAALDEALELSEARFRSLSETAADVVFLIDDVGTIVYVSPSSFALLGYTPAELVGHPAAVILPGGAPDLVVLIAQVSDALSSSPAFTSELQLQRADGTSVWVGHSTSAVHNADDDGRTTFRISVRDITERRRLESELAWQALHDPLTGLGNRILLHRQLNAVELTSTHGLAVLLVDLDGFKEVNDTFGHALGDEVLRIIAARLTRLTRPADTLARTGGDEFVVLCPDTASADAVAIGERIIAALMNEIVADGMSVNVGASVGVAHHRGPGITPDWLLAEADRAMYIAKKSGRGRVSVAE